MANNHDKNNEHNTTQQQLNALAAQNMSAACSSPSPTSSAVPVPGGESGYEPCYPTNTPVDASVKRFITHFFEVSDDADRNDEWVGFFGEDATVMMGSDVAKGREGEFTSAF